MLLAERRRKAISSGDAGKKNDGVNSRINSGCPTLDLLGGSRRKCCRATQLINANEPCR